uniref:DPPIV_N domain-containing protein n=1 Tax=Macrostomum lignano TaxID=282301 RepID=A0A1I8JKN3_9PLAT
MQYRMPGWLATKIQLMEPGFCSRDITYWNGNCYKITQVARSLTEELFEIDRASGILQLASFNSSIELHNFVVE